jgi:hypothetical protein
MCVWNIVIIDGFVSCFDVYMGILIKHITLASLLSTGGVFFFLHQELHGKSAILFCMMP